MDGVDEVEVRQGTADDAAVLGRLLWEFNTEFDSETPPADELAVRFGWLLDRADQLALLAVRAGEAVGFGYLTLRSTPYYDGPLAQLEELYVRPDLRDQGIGTALLSRALDLCRERGAGEMHINVDAGDTDTRRFYERHGFSNVLPGTDEQMLFYETGL